jgi:phosphohistidine phosphatase
MPLNIYIVRHAKASSQDFFPGDYYRTLEKEGFAEGMAMASWFSAQGLRPTKIVSSPAIRAFTTCLLFAEKLSFPSGKIILNQSVYDAPYTTLLRVIREWSNDDREVMLVGHNPGLTEILNYFCGAITQNLPTAAVAVVQLEISSWSDATEGCGKLLHLVKP